jgi:NADPH:quinone reductase-like Zn-dependent oxidoreductase
MGATQGTKAELEEVLNWTSKGKLKPVINVVLPFSDMVKGHTMMANGEQIGKTITTPQKL